MEGKFLSISYLCPIITLISFTISYAIPEAIKGPTGTPPKSDTPTTDPRTTPVNTSVFSFVKFTPLEAKTTTTAPIIKATAPFKVKRLLKEEIPASDIFSKGISIHIIKKIIPKSIKYFSIKSIVPLLSVRDTAKIIADAIAKFLFLVISDNTSNRRMMILYNLNRTPEAYLQ